MDNPKQIYHQSEARRLPRTHPCPECGKTGHIDIRRIPGLTAELDPEVIVVWHCEAKLCHGADGFFIESK